MAANKKTPVIQDDPIFNTVNGALLFALNFSHGTVKKPGLATLMGGGSKGRGLGGLDGAAQAGMLLAELEALKPHRTAILVARFTVQSLPCSCARACCKRYRDNPEWLEAIAKVAEACLVVCPPVTHYRVRLGMILRYFGAKASFKDIAAECRVSRNTVSQINSKVVEWLKLEEKKARWEYEGILKVEGIVN